MFHHLIKKSFERSVSVEDVFLVRSFSSKQWKIWCKPCWKKKPNSRQNCELKPQQSKLEGNWDTLHISEVLASLCATFPTFHCVLITQDTFSLTFAKAMLSISCSCIWHVCTVCEQKKTRKNIQDWDFLIFSDNFSLLLLRTCHVERSCCCFSELTVHVFKYLPNKTRVDAFILVSTPHVIRKAHTQEWVRVEGRLRWDTTEPHIYGVFPTHPLFWLHRPN